MSESTDPTPKAENPFTKPWFLASGAVIVVIIVLAVVYALLPPVGAAPNAQPTPTTDKSSAAPSAASGDSICGLPKGNQTVPGPGLKTKWELNGKTAVPTEPKTFGPGKTSNDARTCYAQNPTGALYAAANFFSASIEQQGTVMVEELSAKGPLRDQYLASPLTFAPNDKSLKIQIAGFQIQSYTPQAATVVLGVDTSDDTKFSLTVPMKWEDGDWKVNLDSLSRMAQVQNLSDFVPWAGV